MIKLISCFIITFSIAVFAKHSVGVDMSYTLSQSISEPYSSLIAKRTYTSNNFSLIPYLGIYFGEKWELSPLLGWGYSKSSTKLEDTNSTITSNISTTQHSIQLGCRLFYHAIQGELFDISLGPEVGYQQNFKPNSTSSTATEYSKYYSGSMWLGCPFNIDLHFNEVFSTRLSASLVRFTNSSSSTKISGNSTTNDYSIFSINIKSIFSPTFGFYFTFK